MHPVGVQWFIGFGDRYSEAARDFPVSIGQATEITTKPVLVHFLVRPDLPEAQLSGLISSASMTPPLPSAGGRIQLEVDQPASIPAKIAQKGVDAMRLGDDGVEFLGGRPSESQDMLARDDQVAEQIVLQAEFDECRRQRVALGQSKAGHTDPAATLRTTTSTGMISRAQINCSRRSDGE